MNRAAAIKHGYTTGARGLASRSVVSLTRTRITPNALTASGVTLCLAASLLVLFEGRNEILFYWAAAVVCRTWWSKAFWALWPAWVWFAVMATGNHFWLDCVAGIFVAILAMTAVYNQRIRRAFAARRT